ncbi:TonB-dependent receptor plug domain-containing protein [Muricauda sp. 2012CJ35-5]|uniref:TonB-dependent receptor plug domain-containing protein n=1 Tax=Flagellimonas spongiicola TaxID=2942208 RepID=A0ABT0PQ83_9FLAO|nr:TonB-dependent receptor plug domain-containing protein [Allomuricauda spongiicola]MCL6273554.1 TonB-dependent receptor plug domain-containing protein [Allomuricauda spongiicola]
MTKNNICLFVAFLFAGMSTITAQAPKKVALCWDVSHSMQDRNLEKEFYFLDAYFKTLQDANVDILTFSNDVQEKEGFTVNSGNWSSLKERLSRADYDGGTSYAKLGNYVSGDEVLIFTDGNQNLGTSAPSFQGEVYIINSKKDFDRATLNLLAIVNNGNLVNLALKDTTALNKVAYSGTVYNGTSGLADVSVHSKENPENKVKTNTNGGFQIEAEKGETLVLSYGNIIKEQLLGDSQALSFTFDDSGIVLDEVVVTEEVEVKPEEITTAFGKENKDKVGYAVQSITEEVIPDAATDGNRAIQGKFSGVRLGQNDDLSQIVMRPSNSILGSNYGLIVIDGVPTRRASSSSQGLLDDPPTRSNDTSRSSSLSNTNFIDPRNIAEITVLKGLAATNRFGSMGANGVLLITTKTALVKGPNGEKRDLARLTNNVYDGKLKVNKKELVTPYLKELKNGKSLKEAYQIYLKQRNNYSNLPEYLVDVSNFFHTSSPELGMRILSNVLEKSNSSYEELRATYLKSRENGNYEMAVLIAERMVAEYGNKIQSYMDLALAQKESGNYQEALTLSHRIVDGSANPALNFMGVEKLMGTELRNLVNQQKNNLDLSKVDNAYRNNLTYNARVVLEWSNPDSEFVVQFVNPQKRFFNWEHTDTSDKKRILDELQHGFSSEQFEIVGPDTVGEWILNVTYLGNRTSGNSIPTFLKCTVQYNFGKPNQRSEEFLVRLHEAGEEQQLAKFTAS